MVHFQGGPTLIKPGDPLPRHRAHQVTAHIVKRTFREAAGQHGISASTLTDNGMVYTDRLPAFGRHGGRTGFEKDSRLERDPQ